MAEPSVVTDLYQGRARCTFRPGNHTYSMQVHGHVEKLWQPSVTGILGMKAKPQLVGWAAKESLRYVGKRFGEFQSKYSEMEAVPARDLQNWLSDAEDGWKEDGTATTIGTVAHRFAYEELRYRAGLTAVKPRYPLVADPVLMPDFTPAMLEAANSSVKDAVDFFDQHEFKPLLMERPLWMPQEGFCGTPDFIGYIDGELCVADYKTSKRIYAEYWMQLAALQAMYMNEFPGQVVRTRWAINIKKDGTGLETKKRGLDTFSEDLEAFRACFVLYNWNRKNDEYSAGNPVQVLGDLDRLVARPQ